MPKRILTGTVTSDANEQIPGARWEEHIQGWGFRPHHRMCTEVQDKALGSVDRRGV